MEEDLNEYDLEERLYAMLHHVDRTQDNLIDNQQNKSDLMQLVENGHRSTVRRYWRTGANNNPYQKVNTSKELAPASTKTTNTTTAPDHCRPKEETNQPKSPSPVDLTVFQSPVPQNVTKTIEFLEHEDVSPVVLESSDEDEVVEIALPPKPTIMIESSDEDELHIVPTKSSTKTDSKCNSEHKTSGERDISTSPVPSVVSSVSDEFIRGDCIALNISSRHPDKHSFDFSLHGSDLLVQNSNTPPKKKKRKKNKEAITSTPISTPTAKPVSVADGCFATPKSQTKNKKLKNTLFAGKTLPNPDVYDSDSNQSTVYLNKNSNPYIVTEKSMPSADVYESDSNQSEITKEINTDQTENVYEAYSSDSSVSNNTHAETPKSSKKNSILHETSVQAVDLTKNDDFVTLDNTGISENIVMANVTGLTESMSSSYSDENRTFSSKKDISKYVSSKEPSILNEDLDFDNLKGKEKFCKRRRYSLTTLRAEMEKFYNESWGGEDFNHREIQKNMSRDKSLWAIDPKDRMPSLAQRKVKCNYCNRIGHRDDVCRQKPPVCYMCGNQGHFEPRCPRKICVNCGAPNFMYSTMCRNCSSWPNMRCAECGQGGHPSSHCPDVWRRYHNTINTNVSLEMCTQPKKQGHLYCSGCSRRGHLVHTCRVTIPFSGLPINTPFVCFYRPIFCGSTDEHIQHNKPVRSKSFSENYTTAPTSQRSDRNKRLSKSPTVHETHTNKRRNVSGDETERQNTKSPVATATQKNLPAKEVVDNTPKNKTRAKSLESSATVTATEKAPDFIPVSSSNHDNKGQVIQDNEVSDTSDVVTSARIYVTNDIINKLKTKDGEDWLKETTKKLNVVIEPADINSFLSIKGKLGDQEAFQSELRDWTQPVYKAKNPSPDTDNSEEPQSPSAAHNLPKNRNNLLRQLNKALESLKEDLGDPKALYKELTFSQNKHEKLLKQKVVSPAVISNSRTHINNMLKKLNIILLGQAGLADGSEHVHELLSFKQKLMNSRQKTISPSLRKEIGEHYHCIFSPSARDDYSELMNKYYIGHATSKLAKKKKKRKLLGPKPNIINMNTNDTIPSEENSVKVVTNPNKNIGVYSAVEKAKILQQLMFYEHRLKSVRPIVAGNKVSKQEILLTMRKVHAFIAMLFKRENITSKIAKKVKRIQEQARKCLADI